MRRILPLLLVALVAVTTGCTRYAGPLAVRKMDAADAPGPDGRPYTPEQQSIRARERYSIPSDDFRIGPRMGFEGVDPTQRYTGP